MGSFFGFNTSLPPLSEDEMRALDYQNGKKPRDQQSNYQDAADVYDFATLRDELGHDDKEDDLDDGLGDQLIEEGDDSNNLTFDDAPIGKDFDFAGNTQKFSTGISEEEAFFSKRKQNDDQAGFRNPWAAPSQQSSSTSTMGRNFGKASPMGPSKSIWGNFGGGLSQGDSGYSLSGSQSSLSPFSGGNRQPMRQQPQQGPQFGSSPLQGVSPTTSATYQQQQQQQQQRNPQPVLLEDIEAEMQRQAALRYRMEQDANGNNGGAQKPMSLAEVEAALAAGARAQQQPPPVSQQQQQQPQQPQQPQQEAFQEQFPPFGYGQSADPMQMLAMKQQQELMEQMSLEREMKRRQNLRKSQYDGLMTQHDKDVVNRIQLSQLASGDPYMDDFYYQVYSSLRRRAGLPTWQSTHNNSTGENGRGRGRREENMMQRMQQQLQRIVNEAKRRPKQTQVSLEGALGKITSLTVRNPRQVLQVSSQQTSEKTADQHHPPAASGESKTKVDNKRNVLKIIEDMYTIILELEQMSRQGPPVPREKDDGEEEKEQDELKDETLDAAAAFHEKLVLNTDKLWNALRIDESDDATPFLISLLSIAKGMKLIPRIFRQLSNDQSLTMLTVIVTHFSKLVVCRNVIYPGTAVADVDEAKKQLFVTYDNVELFMNATAPPLLRVIAEAPLSTVVHLFQLLIQKNNVVMVAQTKPGLAFLTMLLSRAEILKQGGGVLQGLSAPSQEELAHWQELYGYLFETLRNRYISTFPSMYYLVPIIPNTPMIQLSLNVDDIYVWQFLAAMAVGASMDQQHILVTDVRDRVMENIVLAKSNRIPLEQANHRIANVNLFLHALGLDASQVSAPM